MRNLRWVFNTLAKFRLGMIILTVAKDRIYFFFRKKERLFRASLTSANNLVCLCHNANFLLCIDFTI